MTLADREPKTTLTREEMVAILTDRIQRAHAMTPKQYFAAKKAGTLRRKPADAGIEVFAGEHAKELQAARKERIGGQRALSDLRPARDVLRPRAR